MTASGRDSLVDWEYWYTTWPSHPVALTRANAADGYPKPLTPLSQDLILTFEEAGVRKFFHDTLGASDADASDPYMQALYGLVYLNADQLAGLGEIMPGSSRQSVYKAYMGLAEDPAYQGPPASLAERVRSVTGLAVAPRMLALAGRLPDRIDGQLAQIRRLRPAGAGDDGELTERECLQWMVALERVTVEAWESLMTGAGVVVAVFEMAEKMVKAAARGAPDDLIYRLHTGLGGNESAETGRAVRTLAALARDDPQVAAAIRERRPLTDIRAVAPGFAVAVDEVISRYGYRATPELELAVPTWRQDPERLLAAVRSELAGEAAVDRTREIREAAEAELDRRVRSPFRAAVWGVLTRSRNLMAMRENSKVPAVLIFDELRRMLEHAGPHLVRRDVLADARDAVYLTYSELGQVLAGGKGPGLREIERRGAAHARCLGLDLPELVLAGPGFVRPLPESEIRSRGLLPAERVAPDVATLRGVGASPGTVTGMARVLLDPDDDFDAGDILFARTVDPGWSAIVSGAKAVVLDIGGPLSHGAVIARELGIPCVVNVKVGASVAENGSTVTVNGSTGEVRLRE